MEVKCNSEIISKLDLDEQFIYFSYNKYRGIKELSNGNFILLFENIFYYINSKTFRVLNIGESLKKYFCENTSFSYIEEINEQLVGIISNNYVLDWFKLSVSFHLFNTVSVSFKLPSQLI